MSPNVGGPLTGQAEAILREQYASLSRQIPLMYLLVFLNMAFVSLVAGVDTWWKLGAEAGLAILIAVRAAIWFSRRNRTVSVDQIRRFLKQTIFFACALSFLFGAWGFSHFSDTNPFQSTAVALYIFIAAISCCYCLQALPVAARLVLLFGATPVTMALFLSQDWYFKGIGLSFLLAGAVILRTIATTRSAVFEALRSRSEMAFLMEALRRSEEHYRYSVELNPQIPWISDPEGRILELSPRWSELTGLSLEESLGWGWTSAVHKEDLPLVIAHWTKALTKPSSGAASQGVRYRLCHGDGNFRWCLARGNPRRNEEGEIVRWYGNLEDIHDQVTAELALRESEERYRLASRATNDVIWDWSHSTDRIEWGSGVENILGYPEAAFGTSLAWWKDRIHPADLPTVLKTYERVLTKVQKDWSHEYRFRHAHGHYVNIFSRGYVIQDEHEAPLRSIGALQDVTVARKVEDDLRWAANHDPLTGLPNRKMFGEVLQTALVNAAAGNGCVGVIVIDVDGFKLINDSLGHAAGDQVLTTVANHIQGYFSKDATVARLGGDEFAVIVPALGREDASALPVARMVEGVADLLTIDESAVHITISAGAAIWPRDGLDAEGILKSADLALYAAKAEGAGAVRGFEPAMRERVEKRNAMLRDARRALDDDRIIPYYQAKIDLNTGDVVGFEALLRWSYDQHTVHPPSTIEAAFEDSLLSTQLTDRMLDRVLKDMTGFSDKALAFGRIAFNGSPADFRRGDFADRILERCLRAGLSPALLELEVTESVFVGRNASHVERLLRLLVAEGVTIALDDFGTGFASLTHLQHFPVDVLKIDRSFISHLDKTSSADAAIVHGVIDIARRMNILTVAEGVETAHQTVQLRALGCDIAQGFLFSQPIAAEDVAPWLAKWQDGNQQAEFERIFAG